MGTLSYLHCLEQVTPGRFDSQFVRNICLTAKWGEVQISVYTQLLTATPGAQQSRAM